MQRRLPKHDLEQTKEPRVIRLVTEMFSRKGVSRRLVRSCYLCFLVMGLGSFPLSYPLTEERLVPSGNASVQLSFAPVVDEVAPAVVNIYTRKRVVRSRASFFNDPFFERFFGGMPFGVPRERIESSLGSGVIIGSGGLIVTNQHVIAGSDEIIAVLADRREFEAEIVGTDEKVDLAVLRINSEGEAFPFLEFGDSDTLEVGDIVLAIGNPFGVGQTVTGGIVSALARSAGLADWRSLIQTDAAINPGNSGGALVTLDKKLIGVNTAIYSQSGGSIGIGFAIPVNLVRVIVDGLVAGGELIRPWLGVLAQTVDYDMGKSLNMSFPRGVIVREIHADSPAREAGLQVGDVILSFDSHEIYNPQGLRFRTVTSPLNEKVLVEVFRDGFLEEIKVRIILPPEDPDRDIRSLDGQHPLSGAVVGNLSPGLAQELGLNWAKSGVVVVRVDPGYAAQVGLRPGDIILELGGKIIFSTEQLVEVLGNKRIDWEVKIDRGGKLMSVVVRL
jgi:Do/DeqQ family serine protease